MLYDLSKVIHWKNILTVILLLCFLKFSFLDNFGFVTPLNYTNFYLLLVAISLIFSGSSFIISYFSKAKAKAKESNTITKRQLLLSYYVFSSLGILIGVYISFKTEQPLSSLIFLIVSGFMFFYAKETSTKTLINNFVFAFLKPCALIILWWMDSPLTLNPKQWEIFLSLEVIFIYVIAVSFVSNFVNSVFIDMVNIKEDIRNNHRTLPIALGEKTARKIVLQITITIIIASNAMIFYLINDTFLPLPIFLFLIVPQVLGCFKVKKAKNKKDYILLIKTINLSLLLGALIFPLIAYTLKYVS